MCSFFLGDLSDIKEDWRVLFSMYLMYGLLPSLSSDYPNLKEFEKKFSSKLEEDQTCLEAFESNNEFVYWWYNTYL